MNGHALMVDGGLIGGRGFTESETGWNMLRQALGAPPKDIPKPE